MKDAGLAVLGSPTDDELATAELDQLYDDVVMVGPADLRLGAPQPVPPLDGA